MSSFLAAGSYLAVPVVTVLVATRGRPRSLFGGSSDQDAEPSEAPDTIEKVMVLLYPVLLAFLAAIVWAALWFGLYAVD